jgi:hypothetical protein
MHASSMNGWLSLGAFAVALSTGCGPVTESETQDHGSETQDHGSETDGDSEAGDLCLDGAHTGDLAWSQLKEAPAFADFAVDPSSSSGDFYLTRKSIEHCLKRYGGDGDEMWTRSGHVCDAVAVDSAGDVILAGSDVTQRPYLARIIKLNSNGEEQWSVDYPEPDVATLARDVAIDPHDEIIVVGTLFSPGTNIDTPTWVMKLGSDGTQRWFTVLPGTTPNSSLIAVGVDAAGGITVGHNVDDDGSALSRVHRLSPDGDPVWTLDLEHPAIRLVAMAVDDAGRTAIAWSSYDQRASRWLTLLDADGTAVWAKESEEAALGTIGAVGFAPCDTLVVAGSMTPDGGQWGERRIWLSKLDLDGGPLWSQLLGGEHAGGRDNIDAITVDPFGGVLAAGSMTVDIVDIPPEEDVEEEGSLRIGQHWLGRFEP